MARKRELKVEISGDSTGAKKAFKGVDDAADNTEGKLSKVGNASKAAGVAMAAGIGAGAIGVGKELFQLGADLEQMAAKAETVFGDQLPMVKKWAEESANAMGLTSREAVGLATDLADLLKPMGFNTQQAAEMSTKITGLSGALSAWSSGKFTAADVSDRLTKALLGETDGLKGLGISISAAEVNARLLDKGQKDLTGTALAQAEALATVELIYEKSTDAQAAFADGVQSTNEKMAEQSAKFREAKEELGVKFLPLVISATEKMAAYAEATFDAKEGTKGLQGAMFDLGQEMADIYADFAESDFGKWFFDLKDRGRAALGDPLNKDTPKFGGSGGGDFTAPMAVAPATAPVTQNITIVSPNAPEAARTVDWLIQAGKAS